MGEMEFFKINFMDRDEKKSVKNKGNGFKHGNDMWYQSFI